MTLSKALKRLVVGVIGREAANRLSAPYHNRLARRQTRRFLAGLRGGDLRLNLGCGYRSLAGWINLDRARGPQVQVVWDLGEELPFATASCSVILAEHVIEHLNRTEGERLLQECHRVLCPGGVLRVSTPDAEHFLRSYVGDRTFLFDPCFERPAETAMDRINHMMREDGQHLWCYDAELLTLLFRRSGFVDISTRLFGESTDSVLTGIDSEARRFESLYVEGTKAANGIVSPD